MPKQTNKQRRQTNLNFLSTEFSFFLSFLIPLRSLQNPEYRIFWILFFRKALFAYQFCIFNEIVNVVFSLFLFLSLSLYLTLNFVFYMRCFLGSLSPSVKPKPHPLVKALFPKLWLLFEK